MAVLAAGAALASGERSAHALEPSTKGPLYIQGAVIGYNTTFGNRGYGAYKIDVEFGGHFSGRHDGFVIAGRQSFNFGWGLFGYTWGSTVVRLGFDIPIVVKDGKFEITIAPYGIAGLAYAFCSNCGGLGFNWGFGVEGKFFPMQSNGFYAFARPLEIQFLADGNGFGVGYSPAIGVGYAF